MRKLFGSVPTFRHWVSGGALVGFALTIYNVLLSMTQIAQAIEEGLPIWWWILSGIGVALSVVAWYALANNNAQNAEAKLITEQRHLEVLEIKAVVQRESGKVLSAVEAITDSRTRGSLVYGTQLQDLVETARSSAATMGNVVRISALGTSDLLSTKSSVVKLSITPTSSSSKPDA